MEGLALPARQLPGAPAGSGLVWLRNLQCYNHELYLHQCVNDGLAADATGDEDAAVLCYNNGETFYIITASLCIISGFLPFKMRKRIEQDLLNT